MDKNKLKVLQEIQYQVRATCGSCNHSSFRSDDWGTCGVWSYQHLKHSTDVRDLSINKAGYCESWTAKPGYVEGLGGFKEFLGP
jgi:hypothetical protein